MSTQTLTQSATLTQHLSYEMTQKLSVLQTPTAELLPMVQRQMEQNPALELESAQSSEISLEDAGLDEDNEAVRDEELRQLTQIDDDWRGVPRSASSYSPESAARREFMMNSLTKPMSLLEAVTGQLSALPLDDQAKEDVLLLLGYLDDNGWLLLPMENIAMEENRPLEALEEARKVMLTLEPAGLGALGLRECLMTQLERSKKTKTLEYFILRDCFPALSRRKFQDIAKQLDVEPEDAMEAAMRITELNPRPAQVFDPEPEATSITPELRIEKQGGKWTVILHREFTPVLRISHCYKNIMNEAGNGSEVRDYLREHIRKGRYFIRCLEERQETIRKVATEIVSRQQAFLEHGPAHLKPMTMAQIAEVVGVHETTISRTVGGKFAMTPHGVFELRSLFTSGMATESGENVSCRTVEAALKQLVEDEDGDHPYTDAQLSEKLGEAGIRISRRTVVKYRDRLGILPAALRRCAVAAR
ncbi:MAG TPA: RNA polymerase factor sigma-54 [Verrucomicrobiales bacterium]|nr:RNA polymerase factor sigma-54 [Verrucomicrobiales bacterium]